MHALAPAPDPRDRDERPDTGWRLVRLLGGDAHTAVHLARSAAGEPIVVTVAHDDAGARRVYREAAALDRAAGAHVVPVLDLGLVGERPALACGDAGRRTLGAVLASRGRIEAGEAVTALAPIAATVARLHERGVVHGGIGLETVVLSDVGEPVLVGFADARLLDARPSRARLEAEPGVAGDVLALRALVRAVLDRVPGAPTLVDSGAPSVDEPAALAEAVFDLAPSRPIVLRDDVTESSVPSLAAAVRGAAARTDITRVGVAHVPDALAPLVERGAAALDSLFDGGAVARVRALAGTVRRPVWIVAAVAAIGLLGAFALTAPNAGAVPDAGETDAPHASVRAASPPAASAGGADSAAANPVAGDDVVAAATALLATRHECFRQLSLGCLEAVDEADGAQWTRDAAWVRAALDGGDASTAPWPGDTVATVDEVQRLGDVGLARVTDATGGVGDVVLVRHAGEWRLRDVPQTVTAHGAAG